jgi:hypothetical protein
MTHHSTREFQNKACKQHPKHTLIAHISFSPYNDSQIFFAETLGTLSKRVGKHVSDSPQGKNSKTSRERHELNARSSSLQCHTSPRMFSSHCVACGKNFRT